MPLAHAPGLQTPAEGIPLWIAKLRAERKSEGNPRLYEYLARCFFKQPPPHGSTRGATARIGVYRSCNECLNTHDLI